MNPADIKTIEAQSREEIVTLLQNNGLGKDKKQKHRDYSKAKYIVFKGQFINCDIYDKQISLICDYLKL